MKKALLLLSVFAWCTTGAQVIQQHPSPAADIDYTRLGRIDTLVNTYVRNGWIKGAVTLVIKDNRLIQNKGYGYADAEAKKPMMPDELFRIASQTKAIVSVGLMTLWEEGRFTLDEPISDVLPAYAQMTVLDQFNKTDTTYTTVPAKRGITFRDLLTHTSGLDYPGIGSDAMKAIYAKAGIPSGLGVFDKDLKERMNALAALPLVHQPGEKWQYGLSVDLIGCLIEVMSGQDLETFLRERLFRPLGMKDTYFNVPAAKAGRLSAVYTEDDGHHIHRWAQGEHDIDPDYPLVRKHYFSGGAGLTSTAWDYAVFLQMMLNKGIYNGARILAPRTVELMTSGQLDAPFNGTDNFGLGFEITSAKGAARGARNEGTFSWGGFFGTTYWADPKAKLVCLIMTQQTPNSHGDLAAKFEQVVYQSLP
ncbi:serine hydrolase domain-containing protein [Dinghuibacter silviterrae]|uniref:CubicO group peptidase (Beta-lactamase class C family) n=1 Tax=Dinghuibacter silviterrae TaxID=1539049 RepID=A0A4R8DG10_9BACT|nr:serine hydrolase domain-containing protein [Dinghuibacter silviterrae]TDW96415.1 CubicO group peptidase (beta-lactamase class C family) [Dinghuibacter silviterrae]